jgi:hypothetical protein
MKKRQMTVGPGHAKSPSKVKDANKKGPGSVEEIRLSRPSSIGDPRHDGLGIGFAEGVLAERLCRFLACLRDDEVSMDVIR